MISTREELETAAANWLDRSDLVARIPEFIELAEAKFNRIIRAPDMLTRDDAFSLTGQYADTPTRFLEARRFTVLTTPVRRLEYLTPDAMAEYRERLVASQKPGYYTVVGGSFEFLPSPDSTYTASLLFYQALEGLATTDTNWLLTSHPDVYLYGTLLQAEPYLRNDERIAVWGAMLENGLAELRTMNQNKALGGTPVARARSFG
jgi:hypothetical protein